MKEGALFLTLLLIFQYADMIINFKLMFLSLSAMFPWLSLTMVHWLVRTNSTPKLAMSPYFKE